MKPFIIAAILLCFPAAVAAQSLTIIPTACDNGQLMDYLTPADSMLSVRLSVEITEPCTLRAVLNGNFHHTQIITESGVVTVSFDHLGPGEPFHVATFSLWAGGTEIAPSVFVENMRPWVYVPPLSLGELIAIDDTLIHWRVDQGPWAHLPNEPSGIGGGCPEHELVLIPHFTSQEVGVDTIPLVESWNGASYESEESYGGPLENICMAVSLVRIDRSTQDPPDFEPIEVSTGNFEGGCVWAGGNLSTSIDEVNWEPMSILGNAVHFTAAGTYTLYTTAGTMVATARVANGERVSFGGSGMHILNFVSASGMRHTKKLVCE